MHICFLIYVHVVYVDTYNAFRTVTTPFKNGAYGRGHKIS